MATDTHAAETETDAGETHEADHVHGGTPGGFDPHDKIYWIIALILAVLTGAEVTTYTHESTWRDVTGDNGPIIGLYVMMAIKFFMITWWFMHLKGDWAKGGGGKLLTWIFYLALLLAVAVYIATLGTFRVLPV